VDDPSTSLHTTARTPLGDVGVHVWPALDAKGVALDEDVSPTGRPGAGRRPVLVALHGWTDGGVVFGPLAEALGRRWTVIGVDAGAHGRTPWPAPWQSGSRYVVADSAAQAAAVVDALPEVAGRRAPVVVLGHSMGAVSAARVAAALPDLVVHAVLEDPPRTTARAVRNATRWRRGLAALQQLSHDERVALSRNQNPRWSEADHQVWAASKAQVDIAHLRVPIEWGEPLVALLADVTVPVTLIHGRRERGSIVAPAAAARCAKACRAGCEVVQLDAGHSVFRDAPAPYVAVLASVLSQYEH
jgi:pimeloyl-ACP methyl ester carboxylesterase